MTGGIDQRTIDAARDVDLAALIGRTVKLRRAGRGWTGLCPFHKENTPSFSVSPDKGFYHCFGCGAHGDAIQWLQETAGVGFLEAVKSLLGGSLPDPRAPLPETARRERAGEPITHVSSLTAARWIFETSGSARGEIVENWLSARGLDPSFEPMPGVRAIDALRFHPRCPASLWRIDKDPEDHWPNAPAMVAPITDNAGARWGVHVTYLSADGRSKAALPKAGGKDRPTRKIFGKVQGNAVWLSKPGLQVGGQAIPVVVGEGIETTWSFAQSFGHPCALAAALSLDNLQGGAKRLRDGALPLWNIEADCERPPFVDRRATEALILVDADMKPLRGQRIQRARGEKPVKADISGMERASICASLAVQHWRRAGVDRVSAVRPPAGMDFNDSMRSAA